MLIKIKPVNMMISPIMQRGLIFSLKNSEDIKSVKMSAEPCAKGYICMADRRVAAKVLK